MPINLKAKIVGTKVIYTAKKKKEKKAMLWAAWLNNEPPQKEAVQLSLFNKLS